MANKELCPKAKEILGKHDKRQSGEYVICSRKCGYKVKGKLNEKKEVMPSLKIKDLMFGRNQGTLKGGKLGNKADREVSSKMHRQNPPK